MSDIRVTKLHIPPVTIIHVIGNAVIEDVLDTIDTHIGGDLPSNVLWDLRDAGFSALNSVAITQITARTSSYSGRRSNPRSVAVTPDSMNRRMTALIREYGLKSGSLVDFRIAATMETAVAWFRGDPEIVDDGTTVRSASDPSITDYSD